MTCSNSHDALPPPPAHLPRLPTRRTSACSPPAFGLIKMPSKLTPHPHFQRGLAGNSSIGLESDASHPSGRLTRRMSNLSVVLFRQPTTVCLLLAPDRDGEGGGDWHRVQWQRISLGRRFIVALHFVAALTASWKPNKVASSPSPPLCLSLFPTCSIARLTVWRGTRQG